MRCLSLSSDDFVVYDDKLAGFFNTYRPSNCKGIHRIENRVLSEEEVDSLKTKLDTVEDIELEPNTDEDYDVIYDIVKFYPEIRYLVHGYHVIEAKKPKRIVKKKEKQRLQKEAEKAKKDPEKPKEQPTDTVRKPELEKELKKAEDTKKVEEEKKDKVEKEEKKLSEVGKDKNPYTGFKGLLFNMFKKFEDPKSKAEKERRLKELRENWKFYEQNKKLLEENAELVDSLHSLLDEGKITPKSIALLNELIARDKSWVKQIDVEVEAPTISIDLKKFKDHIDIDSPEDIGEQLKDLFKKEKIENAKLKIDTKKGVLDVTTDWNNALKTIKTFNIKPKDLTKNLVA